MLRLFCFFIFSATLFTASAQQTREQLEKQRAQLRKEIAEAENLLKQNKAKTKENFLQWKLVNDKVALQDKVVNNLNNDIKVLNNNMYLLQKDINRYNKLLDTLKQEYATSMVYAYKNRSNFDFMNFIFSADNFNDAVKRVAYLKSYRNYRQMQGQNILRTQQLRQERVDELKGARVAKNQTLTSQSHELKTLEEQKKEKDRIAAELQKQGGQISKQISDKRSQMARVNSAVNAAIRKAQDEARKIAAAKKAEEDRRRREEERALAARLREEERLRREEEERNRLTASIGNASTVSKGNTEAGRTGIASAPNVRVTPGNVAEAPKPVASNPVPAPARANTAPAPAVAKANTPAAKPVAKPANELLPTSESVALNASFEGYRGRLPWPLDKGYVLMHSGSNKLPSGSVIVQPNITIASDIGAPVKAVFDGNVILITTIDDIQVVTIQHGLYYTSYSNLSGVSVKKDQTVKTGQVIGRVAPNIDGVGAIEFFVSKGTTDQDPERWLQGR